ncbi:GroES-like protein [Viridothelium virens]|uniref:GroES-like protein n=1 Tax=Viridothelium virens TaxID=1048519 RepID=A0A6A6HCH4_VIRVR|nr:GroES-like protein [Viridothelium virens]
MSNQAAWMKKEKANLVVDTAEFPVPESNELLVKNAVIGLNPIEAKIQKLSLIPIPYPNILGLSFAGTVEKVGSSVTAFKPGDRVAVERSSAMGMKPTSGAYQKYVIADSRTTSKLEDNTTFEAGAATIVNLATAAVALGISLKLDRPNPTGPNPANKAKKVLIYGGSSSVGGFAINFAISAGYTVITTSSPANSATVNSLQPARVIDHTQPAETIVAELKAAGPYDAVFDTIGLPTVTTILGQVLAETGGEYYTTIPPFGPPNLPANVQRRMESYPSIMERPEYEEFREWFYGSLGQYLGTGRADKLLAPEKIEKIAGGLGGLQGALDKLDKGVSGKKLVVEL